MYGDVNPFADKNNAVKNELVIQNLIAIANNPIIFQRLEKEVQHQLVATLLVYTEENLEAIAHYRSVDFSDVHKWVNRK